MNVLIKIKGRQAIPARAIPLLTNWATVSANAIAHASAKDECSYQFHGLHAFNLEDDEFQTVSSQWWAQVGWPTLAALTDSIRVTKVADEARLHELRIAFLKGFPPGAFVWADEFVPRHMNRYMCTNGASSVSNSGDVVVATDEHEAIASLRETSFSLNFDPHIPDPILRRLVMEGFEMDSETNESLEALIEPFIDGPFDKMTVRLRARVTGAIGPMPDWDDLTPDARRSLARQHDSKQDPSNRPPEFQVVATARYEAAYDETIVNGRAIRWRYWVEQMPHHVAAEAARLMSGLDPDIFKSIDHRPDKFDASALCEKAGMIQRLAEREGKNSDTPRGWLEWADEKRIKVHVGYRLAIGACASAIAAISGPAPTGRGEKESGASAVKTKIASEVESAESKCSEPQDPQIDSAVISPTHRPRAKGDLLAPVVAKASAELQDPFDANLVWPVLRAMACDEQFPFVGVDGDRLKWKDGKNNDRFLRLRNLRERLQRLQNATVNTRA